MDFDALPRVKVSVLRGWILHNVYFTVPPVEKTTAADLDEAADLLIGGPLKGAFVSFYGSPIVWTKNVYGGRTCVPSCRSSAVTERR